MHISPNKVTSGECNSSIGVMGKKCNFLPVKLCGLTLYHRGYHMLLDCTLLDFVRPSILNFCSSMRSAFSSVPALQPIQRASNYACTTSRRSASETRKPDCENSSGSVRLIILRGFGSQTGLHDSASVHCFEDSTEIAH